MKPIITVLLIAFFAAQCSKKFALATVDDNGFKTVNNFYFQELPCDTCFVNIKNYDTTFVFDMKYATNDNFLKQKVYDCAECFLRYKTVKNLIAANNEFKKMGYTISFFDCYRPIDVQKKMWQLVSNSTYVANPAKGSIHNRGCAVDITLIDANGNMLNMGTNFDYFGPEAAHNYKKLDKQILKNRKLLKKIMRRHNFLAFESEWWHYNLVEGNKEKLANFKWNCSL